MTIETDQAEENAQLFSDAVADWERANGHETQADLAKAAAQDEPAYGPNWVEQLLPGTQSLVSLISGKPRKFDFDARMRYIEAILRTGLKMQANLAAGVSFMCVQDTLDKDASFAEAVAMAWEFRRDMVRAAVHKRGVEGVIEPKFGRMPDGTHGVIGHTRVYSDSLLTLEAKRIDPEYRNQTGDGGIGSGEGGGVLIIELLLESQTLEDDWESAWNGITIDGEVKRDDETDDVVDSD